MPVNSGVPEWGVFMIGIDVPLFQEYLYYPSCPPLRCQGECCQTIFSVCLVRIDVLSFQKRPYYPLTPPFSCPREWPYAIIGVRLVGVDVL